MLVALGGIAWFAWPGRGRGRSHVRWIVRAITGFAVPGLIALALLGALDALTIMPVAFARVASPLPYIPPLELVRSAGLGLLLGTAVLALRTGWARWRGKPLFRRLVNDAPLAARAPVELLPAACVAVTAGVTEELAFRLVLPLAITQATGDAWTGFAIAAAIFAALHRYQPWFVRLLLFGIALIFTAIYLASGALWVAMVIHAGIDLIALVLRPWLAKFNSSGATRS